MNEMVYLIFNTGSLAYSFFSKEERDAKYEELKEEERHYHYTHYYYSTEEMPIGEFICEYKCLHLPTAKYNAQDGIRFSMLSEEEAFNREMSFSCAKCPLKECSPYHKAEIARKEKENVK